ncbi:alkaline phosphatase D family protein [Aeromicrobium sp. CFBP 8757]|uniref:alkaline phosphatase D family protein n=1 Tax=Aeromicrobium sp. CFBP 8757 TaxID=2775288 RepID=UPI0017839B6F|nr:alkaline phosphatase D family protein [Aeromicrobium sp. CFBP 8757]MBD8607663.1 alkaline phosphatase D family protein [Aeromicrobium sp. CFBP 8757]
MSGVGVAAGLGVIGPAAIATSASSAPPRVFGHGVASGDPLPDAVVLWTRVTPTAECLPGAGRGPDVDVVWEVARDDGFDDVVASGTVRTGPSQDHTVKVDATGLEPGTDYRYRFVWDVHASPTGRTRTAPAPGDSPDGLRFGVVSCANWQAGWFTSYRHLAERGDLDAVIHLGDYLYEYQPGKYSYGHDQVDVRLHDPQRETVSLRDYRRRHAQYKTDPDLQALHAAVPFVVTWDDHEVADGNWSGGAFEHQPATEGPWRRRVRAAHRAYDEWMPVRISGTAVAGDGERIYRRLQFGRLVDLSMLDLRSYRSKRVDPGDPAIDDVGRTIAGEHQLAWLGDNLSTSPCRWKLVGNPVMVAPVMMPPRPQAEQDAMSEHIGFVSRGTAEPNTDTWNGYTSDRDRLLGRLEDDGVTDTVFLTGDVHSAWATEVPSPRTGRPMAVELVCSSLTSNNVDDFMGTRPRTTSLVMEAAIQEVNPHVRWVNLDDHGFTVLHVTDERLQMDWHAISDRRDPRATTHVIASWAVTAGSARVGPVHVPVPA